MGLIFHGSSEFSETVKIGESASYNSFVHEHTKKGTLLSHLHSKTPGASVPATQPDMEGTNGETSDNEMDIPTGLAGAGTPEETDFAAGVSQASSPKVTAEDNPSDASSDLIIVDYTPPQQKQQTGGPQVCLRCGSLEKNQSQLIVHIAQFHPSYVYPCRACSKTFFTHNARYKHEMEHTPPNFFCGICAEGFHFMGDLNGHMHKHSAIKPFTCIQCNKGYYAKKSLTCHMELHNNEMYQCEHCPNKYKSKDCLYVHKRGQHGKGYTSPCGSHFKWPGKQHHHMAKCTPCCKYREKKKASKRRKPFKIEETDIVKKEA